MRCILFALAIGAANPAVAEKVKLPSARASFGSARTVSDIQQCLAAKLADLGAPESSSAPQVTTITYGQGKDRVVVEITNGGDVRLVTVSAAQKLGSRQDVIRSCMY